MEIFSCIERGSNFQLNIYERGCFESRGNFVFAVIWLSYRLWWVPLQIDCIHNFSIIRLSELLLLLLFIIRVLCYALQRDVSIHGDCKLGLASMTFGCQPGVAVYLWVSCMDIATGVCIHGHCTQTFRTVFFFLNVSHLFDKLRISLALSV